MSGYLVREGLHSLLGVALAGSLTSTIFAAMATLAAWRFQKRKMREAAEFASTFHPPVSLLKPLHGAEPGLEQYLETFFCLDYPAFEILFCARTPEDAGIAIARKVAVHHPEVPVRFLFTGEPEWPNARCYALSKMATAAAYDIFVITDSDVRVRPEFLRQVVAPFKDTGVSASTCLYVGAAEGMSLSARLEGLGMSVEMAAGVLVADWLEGMRFTLGPAMIVRKAAVASIGGFEALGHYYADDFMLGNLIAVHGGRVVLSSHVIDHCIVHDSFRRNFRHQLNWMKSTRFSRPSGHLWSVLTYATPFGLLGLLSASIMGHPFLGASLLLLAYFSRVVISVVVGGWAVGDRDSVRLACAYPLRDLLGFIFWTASYISREVDWRDDRFILLSGGYIRRLNAVV